MNYPIHINAISMEQFILYFKGSHVEMSIICRISVLGDSFILRLTNSSDPVETPPYVVFYLRLLCLPKKLVIIFQNEDLDL